ncbi:MAG TPA: hypothetical protein VFA60_10900 [Terriglobales bacterium]|nr:hypothetical protein [Terriglobales bacterium]
MRRLVQIGLVLAVLLVVLVITLHPQLDLEPSALRFKQILLLLAWALVGPNLLPRRHLGLDPAPVRRIERSLGRACSVPCPICVLLI